MKTICIIIPARNEEKNILPIYTEIKKVIASHGNKYSFEILFVNDGSSDDTIGEIEKLALSDASVKFIDFSRNFGKEIATTAGINHSQAADACIMLDADLQHPVELIPEFIARWEGGFDVVVGIRNKSKSDGLMKKIGSKLFYSIINRIAEIKVIPNATDYRLIDKVVAKEFSRFTENSRMTRALIDWLGFKRDYVYFDANERLHGTASYSFWSLFRLAINSFVSLSLVPLKLAGYLGIFITIVSGISGFYILIGKYFLHTYFASTFSDAENLAILILFLVGILLMSIGLLALYVANIHSEVINRPMYVVRKKNI
ncbi:MAG: hypothetical protein ACD_67C00137G0002 [uncultured bacterium]|nr:MAG: hypothetical protein ACD_67C00137G0002 [uncultured bacterium]